jgi:hypothetical protein
MNISYCLECSEDFRAGEDDEVSCSRSLQSFSTVM